MAEIKAESMEVFAMREAEILSGDFIFSRLHKVSVLVSLDFVSRDCCCHRQAIFIALASQ